ncbi:MAG TPA: hypothetical protein VE981_19340 [Planctomycetota bacterium]|nr:hypothetical protein [Planctomycetota bacterium]
MLRRAVLFVVLAGCSTPPSSGASPEVRKPDAPPVVQAENPEWAKIAEEALKGLPAEEQQQRLESERRYHLALAWFNKADFDKAKIEAQRAVQAWTENMAARKLLNDINEIIVGGPTGLRGIRDVELQVCGISVEQAKLEIENHLLRGRRYQDAGMHAAAIREFEDAEFKIRNMPYEVKSMNDQLPALRASLARSRSSLKD